MLFNYTLFFSHWNIHLSFPFCFPQVGGSIRCITGLMASLHSDLSPAISICLLRGSKSITPFHFNPGLPRQCSRSSLSMCSPPVDTGCQKTLLFHLSLNMQFSNLFWPFISTILSKGHSCWGGQAFCWYGPCFSSIQKVTYKTGDKCIFSV